jgi:APA family basic amino acid/polyamine antiporter
MSNRNSRVETQIRFDRKSGLVRQLSAWDVFLVNTFGYALGIALTINPVFIGSFAPSAKIYIVLALGLVAALFNGFTYGLFSAIMPKTGGDYIYISRMIGMGYGFVASFGFTLAQLYGLALNCYWAFSQAVAPGIATYGMARHDQRLVSLATVVGQEKTSLLLGLSLMLVILGLALLGLRVTKWLFKAAFVVAMCGPVLLLVAFFSVTHAQFIQSFDSFMHSSGLSQIDYASIVEAGRAHQLDPHPGDWLIDSARALPLGFLMFLGFTYSAYMGSEVNEASKSQIRGIFWALGVGAFFFFIVMDRYYAVVGPAFNAALGVDSVSAQMPAGTSMAFFAGIILKNGFLNGLMNIGIVVWFLLVPLVILQVCSRNIQVWAVDYLFPEAMCGTNRFGVPWLAASTGTAIGALFLIQAYLRHSYAPVGAVALAAGSILLCGIAAIFYVVRFQRKALPKGTSRLRSSLFAPTSFFICGSGTVLFFGWILYAAFMHPEIAGTKKVAFSLILVGTVYGFGTLLFNIRKAMLIRRLAKIGMTLEDIWGDLPED